MNKKMNVKIYDNGAAYMIMVNGLIATYENSLGGAWRHIQWMYEIAQQDFTVGDKQTPVKDWLAGMMRAGYLDKKNYSWMED